MSLSVAPIMACRDAGGDTIGATGFRLAVGYEEGDTGASAGGGDNAGATVSMPGEVSAPDDRTAFKLVFGPGSMLPSTGLNGRVPGPSSSCISTFSRDIWAAICATSTGAIAAMDNRSLGAATPRSDWPGLWLVTPLTRTEDALSAPPPTPATGRKSRGDLTASSSFASTASRRFRALFRRSSRFVPRALSSRRLASITLRFASTSATNSPSRAVRVLRLSSFFCGLWTNPRSAFERCV